jgi:flagellar hook-length control protein FliK
MNAIPAVSQPPANTDPAQAGGPAQSVGMEPGAKATHFAAALQNADSKPTRKPAATKGPDGASTGGHSPPPGNPSPPAALPVVLAAPSLAGTIGGGAVQGTLTSGTAPLAAAAPISVVGAANQHLAPGENGPASRTAAVAVATPPALGDPGKDVQTQRRSGAVAPLPTARDAAAAAATDAGVNPATVTVTAAAAAATATAATNAATSSPAAADGNAAAQTATAAAISAAATGAVALASGAADSSSSTVDKATPAGGVVLDAADSAGGAAPRPQVAVAQAASPLATIGAADKHSHNGNGDSSSPGTPGGGAAGAAQLSANLTTVSDAAATPILKVAAGVETPEFGQGVASHVSWMVDNNLNGAKLQVNPPQLGPIEVRIAVQGDHAQVWLISHSALTRDALESSSPKLREMLGAQGFAQVSVDISQRSFQERSTHSQPYEWTPSANRSPSTTAVQSTLSSIPRASNGAVDAYA